MRDWAGKRYWIVGASEGLGRALAHRLSKVGAELILSARSEERLQELARELPGRTTVVPCDIADIESCKAAAAAAGEIDGLVFLAGVYWPMKAQDWDPDQVVQMFDINLTGAARVLGQVVPGMLVRNAGHIVLTGSLSAYRGLPGTVGYAASKAGILSLAESMHCDLRRSGVEVQVANPGFIRTQMTAKNDFAMPGIMDPDEAARRIFEFMCGDQFKLSFPAPVSWVLRLTQFLPDWLYYPIFGGRG